MQNNRSGKALVSTVVVLVWLGLIGGGVYWYVKNEEAKVKFAADEAKRIADEEFAKEDRPKGLGIPPLTVPKDYVEPKRTEPYKYIFSDTAATKSAAGAASLDVKYPESPQSDDEFSKGQLAYMLEGVKQFGESSPDASEELSKLLTEIITAKETGGDLKSMLVMIEPFVTGSESSSDPFVQHIAGLVYLANDKKAEAQQFLLGAINDYPKFEYPSRYPVLAMTQRTNTKPKKILTYFSHERHADAIAHWMQSDFSESPSQHQYCWSILQGAIESLGKDEKLEVVKKLIDKNQEKAFIPPWLAEMISAHYYIQTGKTKFASDEVIANAKKHLNAAMKVNANFSEPTADLKLVEKMANPGEAE